MEGTIFDIKHFAVHDGPGIRQTIFFKGCPLKCWWCHNPESQCKDIERFTKVNKLDGKEFKKEVKVGYKITADELFKIIEGDRVFFEESNGGVTFSGGEPLMQADFLFEITKICKENNIHTCIDTTGFASEKKLQRLTEVADCFLYDIKLIDNYLHYNYTDTPVFEIISNLNWLDQNNKNVILRFPVIPEITNTERNLLEIKSFIKSLKNINRIDLLPYHNISNGKYNRFNKENKMKNVSPLSDNEMLQLKLEFESIGFKVRIGG